MLSTAGQKIAKDLSAVPIILADVGDRTSIVAMAEKCKVDTNLKHTKFDQFTIMILSKVVINCCGPYRFYGEMVVKACIEAGTHHVDISGEPQYIEGMRLKYHYLAQKNHTYIISTCGFDSIPAEMGVLHAEKNFSGLNFLFFLNFHCLFYEKSPLSFSPVSCAYPYNYSPILRYCEHMRNVLGEHTRLSRQKL